MKYVTITGKTHSERHPIDNDVIEYAARLTAESHNMEFPDDPWTVEVEETDEKETKIKENA